MDFYEVLDLERDANAQQIRSAYRRLARRFHPDRGIEGDSLRFRKIREAYETLSDPDLKSDYDRKLEGSAHAASRFLSSGDVWEVFPLKRPGDHLVYEVLGSEGDPRRSVREVSRRPDTAPFPSWIDLFLRSFC